MPASVYRLPKSLVKHGALHIKGERSAWHRAQKARCTAEWTLNRPAHIKSHHVFYFSLVILWPSFGIFSKPFYLEGPPLLFPKLLAAEPLQQKKKKKNKKTTCREQIQLQPAHPRASWSFLKQKTQADTEVVALLGRPQFCCPKSTLTPLDFSQGFIRNHSFSWYFFFPLSFLFLVLISSNKNNEFHKPTRMWQGVNKANQEGDVWPLQCP